MDKSVEILSPAGDMECLDSAINFGANAIYLAGKEFGMRVSPQNFDEASLATAVKKAHKHGIKIYVTCNTLPRDDEITRLPSYLAMLDQIGADAIIVADLGVLALVKKHAPGVDIHISTQAGVVNFESARIFHEMGAKRVVMARELSLDEIAKIRAKTNDSLELECFVHGAMCMSFSGRCLISNYLTGRDANRGDCAQPCRWEYEILEKSRPKEVFSVVQQGTSSYFFNSRDMCMIEHIDKLKQAGVDSLKIEGRAKSAYYVAVITNAYRAAVEAIETGSGDTWFLDEVDKISHREYSTGFYLGGEPGQVRTNGGYIRQWEVVGVVEDYRNGEIILSQRNKFSVGDRLNVLEPKSRPFELTVEKMFDENHHEIASAPHATQTVYLPYDRPISAGAYIRKRTKENSIC